MKNKVLQKIKNVKIQICLAVLLLAIGSIAIVYIMYEYGYFASGYDIWGHLFKSDLMYQNIKEGNYYPLYTKLWYNGIQPFRYWAPLPYYILAGLQWIAGGSIEGAYYLFAGFSFFIGGMGWILWGVSTKRIGLCTFIAFLWFMFPDNIRVYFYEGNLPRMVTAILVPYLVYFIWLFVRKNKIIATIPIILLTGMMALSHLMIAAMMGIATFIFMVFHMIGSKQLLRPIQSIVSMLIGYLVVGIWILPAMSGGLVGMDPEASASVMRSLTYDLLSTMNPMHRVTGVTDTFYIGISIILISVIGIILAEQDKKAGYYTNILILLCTTPALVPILSKLPLSQLFWMMRLATIAYAFFLWSLIEWQNARRYFLTFMITIILIDCIPSFNLSRYYFQLAGEIMDEIETVEDITNQRVAIMDLSLFGSYPSWELGEGENPTQYTYGWAWQGAVTATNIVMLNTALENGYYEYLFDRCIELGNDTVIVRKESVKKAKKTEEYLLDAAKKSEYLLYQETNQTYILHRELPASFGVQTEYSGLAIGKYAGQIVLPYPVYTVGISDNIEDYTFEELAQYEYIYLSGFEYNNCSVAEEMVTRLADNGVRIIIDMTHIPVDSNNNRMHFLGVYSQDIVFHTLLPTLNYRGQQIYGEKFPEEYRSWNTKYIEGISNIIGSANYSGKELAFAGTNNNENIIFIGFNLLFYGMQTDDQEVLEMMSDYLGTELYKVPDRSIVPIDIQYSNNEIIIDSPVSKVNTTIAYQDNFVSDHLIENDNNLLVVNQEHTVIKLIYPHFRSAMLTSIMGVVFSVMWILVIYKIDRKREKIYNEI